MKLIASLIIKTSLYLFLVLPSTGSAISFQEVTDNSGITYIGQSWGASWGDFNGDGWPDLWTSNHSRKPALYINNKDGSFTNIVSEEFLPDGVWDRLYGYDTHGAAWADFDNDGDQDLVQLADGGGRRANLLFINAGNGTFERTEQAINLGISQPLANARTPVWLDWNNDGLLDLLAINTVRDININPVTTLFEQQPSSDFIRVQQRELNFNEPGHFAMLSDLTGNGRKEIIIGATSTAVRVYSNTGSALTEETVNLGLNQYIRAMDASLADLTGNLQAELHIARGMVSNSLVQDGDHAIEAHLSANKDQKGFSFNTTGQLNIELYPIFKVRSANIFIGNTGFHPYSVNFTLDPDDERVYGFPSYTPGTDSGFFIGFDPQTNRWTIYFSTSKNIDARNLLITSNTIISNLTAINFDNNELPQPDLLFVNQGGILNEEAAFHGIDFPRSGISIATADFDNDMDLDIYLLTTGQVVNLPNILYENDGNGNFTIVANAGGAEGSLLGRGDSVSIVDYDQDGFLDLFLTNGKSKPPFERDGPYQLFKNMGNDNHWIEIDLIGVESNSDGIGATVKLTAGGITQMREQNGGMHRRTQNHKRIHFGLGTNTLIEEIQIDWPSGILQTIRNVRPDRIMRITELSSTGSRALQFTSGIGFFEIDKNTSIGNTITILTADNPNNTLINFSIIDGNDDGIFAMDAGSGKITLASPLDAETSNYTLTVMASDDLGLNVTDTVTINVIDISNTTTTINSSQPGGGCSISAKNPFFDPTMPFMLLSFAIIIILRSYKRQ